MPRQIEGAACSPECAGITGSSPSQDNAAARAIE